MDLQNNIKEYEGIYSIDQNGIVTRSDSGKIIKHCLNGTGYPYVSLSKNNKRKNFLVHRLVALAFIPNPENKPQVNHINSVTSDHRISNLEWCTPAENAIHGYRHGNHKPQRGSINTGESHPLSRLTTATVVNIFNESGKQRVIANKYNVPQSLVSKIKTGTAWRHVTSNIK